MCCLYNLGYGVFGIAEIYLTILCSGDIYWILHGLGEGGHREWGYVSGAHVCDCDVPCVERDLPPVREEGSSWHRVGKLGMGGIGIVKMSRKKNPPKGEGLGLPGRKRLPPITYG